MTKYFTIDCLKTTRILNQEDFYPDNFDPEDLNIEEDSCPKQEDFYPQNFNPEDLDIYGTRFNDTIAIEFDNSDMGLKEQFERILNLVKTHALI